jgi:hypothetical protein
MKRTFPALCGILAYSVGGYLIEYLSCRLVFLMTLPSAFPAWCWWGGSLMSLHHE